MRKILYITSVTEKTEFVGVWKKIKMQELFFRDEQIKLDYFNINKEYRSSLKKLWGRLPFTSVYNWNFDKNKMKQYNCIYIRKVNVDYQQIKFLRKTKQNFPDMKIVLEIPTYPYENEVKMNFSNFMLILKDRLNRKKINKYIDYIITYSDDEFIFNIPTLRLSNVINLNNIKPKNVSPINEEVNLIAVANFSYWHGYDRVLAGLHKYYNKPQGGKKVVMKLHLVGEGEELHKYKALVNTYKLGPYVCFYGRKEGEELDEIYNKCEIGLDAMGRHRTGIYYNSTLKGKEYGAKGLPIISGVKTELDNKKEYKYYMRVPADDSPIKIESILEFYNKIYNSTESKEQIIHSIRSYTKTNFDISKNWRKVIDFIKEE